MKYFDIFKILFSEKVFNYLINILQIYTDAEISLHTLLVKYYNDLLGRQSSERGRDEVTFFYVGDLFCIHLGTMYADFQEKDFLEHL